VSNESGRVMRLARSLTSAWLAVTVSSLAHLAASGHRAGALHTLGIVAVLAVAATPLTGRRMSVRRSAGLLLALQLVVHLSHTVAALAASPDVQPTRQLAAELGGGHSHTTARGLFDAGSAHAHAVGGGTTSWGDLLPSPPMLGAHLVVGLLVGWLLSRGEQSWWTARRLGEVPIRLARCLVHGGLRARRLASLTLSAPHPSSWRGLERALHWVGDLVTDDVWRASSAVRRGPPHLLRA
jgi:hypothetical protein